MKVSKLVPAKVCPLSVSRYLPGGEHAVLLIHGFTGSPHDMIYLGTQLNRQGYTVSIPRLPGHGTCYEDFRQSSWDQWLRRVFDEYADLQQRFARVSIAGISMGALLATIVAAKFTPAKLVLAAPAFVVSNPYIGLTPILSKFVQRYRKQYEPDPTKPGLAILEQEYWSWQHVWGARHLYTLQKIATKHLPLVKSDVLTIASRNDTVVPITVLDKLNANITANMHKSIVLKDSRHVVVNDCEKELVAGEISDWLGDYT